MSNAPDALALLRDYRPYFEKIPSIRRPTDSIVPIPLPTVRVRQPRMREVSGLLDNPYERLQLSCDIALLMCDPDWQIKNSEEIFIFIHRPGEEFSNLLRRWRMTQVALGSEYLWDMPLGYEHMLSEGSDKKYPLFILLEESHDRICRGLQGARLPYICQSVSCEDPAPASMVEAAP
ncbi:hypothetical protein [Lyngbya confervoides]|uniref:Uncharacterized protein n=1 Tax=Lyngbya confervoides BDU141951 TaxID=1574623 RepID=A0ABD4T624_9CYAN|nr:hypothetical protein [Lyngbya confervoides]MCM1984106.1 hypothetical protein [Lyngbya confervoides BDU141951]